MRTTPILRGCVFILACFWGRPLTAAAETEAETKAKAGSWPALRGVWRAQLNHDASRIMVEIGSGQTGLWDVATGKAVGVQWPDGTFDMDPGGTRIFAGSTASPGARVYDAKSGEPLSPRLELQLRDDTMGAEAIFSPQLDLVAVADAKHLLHVFEIKTGKRLLSVPLDFNLDVSDLSDAWRFSGDGQLFAVINPKGTLHRYSTADWREIAPALVHPNHEGYTFGAAVSANGKYILTWDRPGENGPKGYLQLWDGDTGQPLGKPLEATNGLTGSFEDNGTRLLVTPARGEAAVYELPTLKPLYVLRQHDDVDGPRVTTSDDGKWLFSWGNDHSLVLYDKGSGQVRRVYYNHQAGINAVHVHPQSKFALVTHDNTAFSSQRYQDNYVVKLSLPDLEIQEILRIQDYLHEVQLSPDGSTFLLKQGSDDHERLRLFNTTTFKEILPP